MIHKPKLQSILYLISLLKELNYLLHSIKRITTLGYDETFVYRMSVQVSTTKGLGIYLNYV